MRFPISSVRIVLFFSHLLHFVFGVIYQVVSLCYRFSLDFFKYALLSFPCAPSNMSHSGVFIRLGHINRINHTFCTKQKSTRNISFACTFLATIAARRGIEPLFPPWEGGVLTAWPTSHLHFIWCPVQQHLISILYHFIFCKHFFHIF